MLVRYLSRPCWNEHSVPGSYNLYISPFSFRILQKKCPRSLSNPVGGISPMFLFSLIDEHHLYHFFRSDWVFLFVFLLRCLSTKWLSSQSSKDWLVSKRSSSHSSKDRQVETGNCWSSRQGSKLVASRVLVGWTRSLGCRWLMGKASSEQNKLYTAYCEISLGGGIVTRTNSILPTTHDISQYTVYHRVYK